MTRRMESLTFLRVTKLINDLGNFLMTLLSVAMTLWTMMSPCGEGHISGIMLDGQVLCSQSHRVKISKHFLSFPLAHQ